MKSVLPLLFFLGSSIAGAETTAELFHQLKIAAKAEVQASQDDRNPARQQRSQQLQEWVVQLNRAQPSEYASAPVLQAIEGLEVLATSDKVADLCQTLAQQLRAEQQQQETALAEEMQSGFTAALRAGLSAKNVKDLDAPMADVSRLVQKSKPDSSFDAKLSLLASQGQQIEGFLRQWQDYLTGLEIDSADSSRGRWQNLANSGIDFSAFVPRSELLTRLVELQKERQKPEIAKEQEIPQKNELSSPEDANEKALKIVAATRDLKDIKDALPKIEALLPDRQKVTPSTRLSITWENLSTLQRIYLDLEQGRATNIHLFDIMENKTMEVEVELSRLRLQLLLYALPRALGLGETEAAQPGENSINYINRLAAMAREKADWALLGRTIDIAQTLKIETTTAGNDRTALQSFLAGINQERSGQYALAVGSFEAALKTGSQIIPPEAIGARLETIRKDRPQDYEQGVQAFLTPPVPSYPQFMDPRMRMPNFPGNPNALPQGGPPPSPPSINVPAAAPKATTTPPPQPAAQ